MGKARTKAQRNKPAPAAPRKPARLPEDSSRRTGSFTLRGQERIQSRPVPRTEAAFGSMREIESRLMTAMKTIRVVPDKERRFFIVKGASIPYLQEYMDAYAATDVKVAVFVPTPKDVSDCLTALSWVRHVDKKSWKVMWLRSFGFSFGLIARYVGRSDETARRWYREGITDAWTTANGLG